MITLNYRRNTGRRNRYVGIVIVAIVLVVSLLLNLRWLHSHRTELERRYWVWRCLLYTGADSQFASGQVVYWSYLAPDGPSGDVTVFCHERIAPNGLRRLIVVDAQLMRYFENKSRHYRPPLPTHTMGLVIWAWDPAAIEKIGGSDFVTSECNSAPFYTIGVGKQCRLLNGVPDSSDPSHFSFQYDLDGVRGTIDGWLGDNGYVRISVRDGPATEG